MGGILSGILGGGSSQGQQQQMGALRAARGDIQRYRPEAMQARLNALNNMTSAFQGANNALETLWGDPNAKPQRMMGHDLPRGMPYAPPSQRQQGPNQGPQQMPSSPQGFNPFDPLGIFGGK